MTVLLETFGKTVDRVDVIVVGAHPDDVEIGCGGTVARLADQGYAVGIVDLTDGEPTPRSPSPEVRVAEAVEAAKILGASFRCILPLTNRRLFDDFEARTALATVFRQFRPRLVLGLGAPTPLASPDHEQAGKITEAAVFYSRLCKWDEYFDGRPPHVIERFMYYYLATRDLNPVRPGAWGIVHDITDTIDRKMAAIAAYRTQFEQRPEVLERLKAISLQHGQTAGFVAGEVLGVPGSLGTKNLMGLLFD
ncbi:MAG: LmbE family protein [Planctomycetota bacterium]|nr:MAG: LmbE family protein [Planctomycetota bacterium]